ncbi:MAG: dienelactone hydrolase family protein [Planctomycetota bacterium]
MSELFQCHFLVWLVTLLTMLAGPTAILPAEEVPQSVEELWADFDPRRDPLEIEVIREFRRDGAVIRHVRFLVATFKGQPARMTAIYGFPETASDASADSTVRHKVPAVMHIHGGGQRGSLSEVLLLVSRGYAGLSVNWGGSAGQTPFNSVEGAEASDPNTDWGSVDPSQLNVAGYQSILPGPRQLVEDREHPKNCNWYVLALGCRRALTFLEQQPEVDPDRLGVHGYSMGGNLTMYVAGSDHRVRAAVPAVGGAGWRWEPHQFAGGVDQQDHIRGDVSLFRRTLSFESYAPLIRCPILHRSSTNDFHGWMDDVYRTNSLIPDQPLRYSWTPHLNHRLSPEVAVSMPLWFDQHLKGSTQLPETPATRLVLQTTDHIPMLRVTPDSHAWPVARVEIFYSVDADPRARFWRNTDIKRDGEEYVAALPLHETTLPLFAFANVYHQLPEPVSLDAIPGYGKPVGEVCLSSQLHAANPADLTSNGVMATMETSPLIDDFAPSRKMRDWYAINADHPTLVQHWTRKMTDPAYRAPKGSKLQLRLKMPATNTLTFVIVQNEWRSYRGQRKTFLCERVIAGSEEEQTVDFEPRDFTNEEGGLAAWESLDQFAICHHYSERKSKNRKPSNWVGPPPSLLRLEWSPADH